MLDKIKRAMGIKDKPVEKEKSKRTKKSAKDIATEQSKSHICCFAKTEISKGKL